ncbi:hypothetical protein AnigIFM60653_008397 [Aspergillus niger]|nr:hypothetical protein AnigIFM60653_008397 [Aspergillus niger]
MPFTNPENEYLENIDFCASYPDSVDNELGSGVGRENRFNAQGASFDQSTTQNMYDGVQLGVQLWAHYLSGAVDPLSNNPVLPDQFVALSEADNNNFFLNPSNTVDPLSNNPALPDQFIALSEVDNNDFFLNSSNTVDPLSNNPALPDQFIALSEVDNNDFFLNSSNMVDPLSNNPVLLDQFIVLSEVDNNDFFLNSSNMVDPLSNNPVLPDQFLAPSEVDNNDFPPFPDSSLPVHADSYLFEPRLHFGFHAFCKWKSSWLFSTTPAKANAGSNLGAKSCSVNKVVSLQFVFEELRISEGIE